MSNKVPISRQIDLMLRYLRSLQRPLQEEEAIEKIVDWVKDIPPSARPPEMLTLLKTKLQYSDLQLEKRLEVVHGDEDFDTLVPCCGWLHDYIKYTQKTEPPTVFHFFAGMVTIGAALARNVLFDMGPYQIYPNLCVVIVAPSGKCRKTSACNMGVGLYKSVGGNVLADKLTPEALIEAFKDQSNACGLIYAPELAVFLGKQKYQEGMVPLLTALFDCPKEWSSGTIMRGDSKLTNVALSGLFCSTMDWIQTGIPRDAFGGGFMSRLLFIVQNDTPRSFAIPPPLDEEIARGLKRRLLAYQKLKGRFVMTDEAIDWYTDWYDHKLRSGESAERQYAGYLERKPDQMKRIAMIMAIAEQEGDKHFDMVLTKKGLEQALAIITRIESWLPSAFEQMSMNTVGEDHARILSQIKKHGGAVDHSKLLRLNSNKLNARQFKEIVDTLRQAKLIEWDSKVRQYYITPEGWSK